MIYAIITIAILSGLYGILFAAIKAQKEQTNQLKRQLERLKQ